MSVWNRTGFFSSNSANQGVGVKKSTVIGHDRWWWTTILSPVNDNWTSVFRKWRQNEIKENRFGHTGTEDETEKAISSYWVEIAKGFNQFEMLIWPNWWESSEFHYNFEIKAAHLFLWYLNCDSSRIFCHNDEPIQFQGSPKDQESPSKANQCKIFFFN